MSNKNRSNGKTIAKSHCRYRLPHEDLYQYVSYEALKIEGARHVIHRTWTEICHDAIIFTAGHYNRYSGEVSETIPYIDPKYRFGFSGWFSNGDEFHSLLLLNKFGLDEKHKYRPGLFVRNLRAMIFHTCIKHFNTANQYALADAMSAKLCPITIHWYDDMVILEITDGRDRS